MLAANRDEFHDRPSASANWWPGSAGILAGKDLKAGGTWLGVRRDGRFAALTNFRDGMAARESRSEPWPAGDEVLESGDSVTDTLERLRADGPRYSPFNMIFSDGERLGVYESVGGHGRELAPGVFGLSNHLLDTPWPKVRNAKSGLSSALTDLSDETAILHLLRDDRPAPDHEIARYGHSAGVGTAAVERIHSLSRLRHSLYHRVSNRPQRRRTVRRVELGPGRRGDGAEDAFASMCADERYGAPVSRTIPR